MSGVIAWLVANGYTGPAVVEVDGVSYQIEEDRPTCMLTDAKPQYAASDLLQYVASEASEDDD